METHLAAKHTKDIRKWLSDDAALAEKMKEGAQECLMYGREVGRALEAFEIARNCCLSSGNRATRSELYSRILAGELTIQSPAIRELLLLIKKSNSGSAINLLNGILGSDCIQDSETKAVLQTLSDQITALSTDAEGKTTKNLTSEFDIADNALRTTAVSRRIQISQHKSGLSTKDSEYSKLIQQVHDVFEDIFSRSFKPADDLFLYEIFFYDYLSPHKDVFSPQQRTAVEDALAKPSEYLSCECCHLDEDGKENVMKSSNPPTSIGYQLFLESGALINAFDLYQAFRTILEGEEDADEDEGNKIDEATAQ